MLLSIAAFQVDQDHSLLHTRAIAGLPDIGRELVLAARYVELPSMPRAGNHTSIEYALAQRPSLVRTDTIECKEGAVYVVQRQEAAIGDNFNGLSWRASGNSGDVNPTSHGRPDARNNAILDEERK